MIEFGIIIPFLNGGMQRSAQRNATIDQIIVTIII